MNEYTDNMKIALLIDADNISANYLTLILNEVTKFGVTTYRRIYGDWTHPQASKWRDQLLDKSIIPIQQFSNISGKNATDSTLIIDAMDILYEEKVDGFCIVSSDSDFTRLASRLRESGMMVVGMGESKTPASFRNACTKFINLQNLADDRHQTDVSVGQKAVEEVIAGIIRDNENRGKLTSLSEVGSSLNNKFPDFDVRNYGYSILSRYIEDMSRFSLAKCDNIVYVSIASGRVASDDVVSFMRQTIGESGSKGIGISELATAVYDAYPNFNLKDSGYSQFYKFTQSLDGILVVEGKAGVKRAKLA